jgi:hypothetical protein
MERLLSAQQVADGFGWHVKTLYRKVRRNEIALNVVRPGRGIAFRPSDVEQFLSARVVVRTGEVPPQPRPRKQKHKDVVTGTARMSGRKLLGLLSAGMQIMSDVEARRFFGSIKRQRILHGPKL